MGKVLLKINEVAQKLRCSKSWIYQAVAIKKIPYVKLGGMLLFDETEIDKWLDDNSVSPDKA